MKKLSILLMFLLCMPLLMAQNIDKVFNSLKSEPNCIFFHLNSNTIGTMEEGQNKLLIEKLNIEEAKVLVFDQASQQTVKKYTNLTDKLKGKQDYETLVAVNDDDNKVLILGKMEDKIATEVLLFVEDDHDIVFVWAKGKLNPEEINKAIQVHK